VENSFLEFGTDPENNDQIFWILKEKEE